MLFAKDCVGTGDLMVKRKQIQSLLSGAFEVQGQIEQFSLEFSGKVFFREKTREWYEFSPELVHNTAHASCYLTFATLEV